MLAHELCARQIIVVILQQSLFCNLMCDKNHIASKKARNNALNGAGLRTYYPLIKENQ